MPTRYFHSPIQSGWGDFLTGVGSGIERGVSNYDKRRQQAIEDKRRREWEDTSRKHQVRSNDLSFATAQQQAGASPIPAGGLTPGWLQAGSGMQIKGAGTIEAERLKRLRGGAEGLGTLWNVPSGPLFKGMNAGIDPRLMTDPSRMQMGADIEGGLIDKRHGNDVGLAALRHRYNTEEIDQRADIAERMAGVEYNYGIGRDWHRGNIDMRKYMMNPAVYEHWQALGGGTWGPNGEFIPPLPPVLNRPEGTPMTPGDVGSELYQGRMPHFQSPNPTLMPIGLQGEAGEGGPGIPWGLVAKAAVDQQAPGWGPFFDKPQSEYERTGTIRFDRDTDDDGNFTNAPAVVEQFHGRELNEVAEMMSQTEGNLGYHHDFQAQVLFELMGGAELDPATAAGMMNGIYMPDDVRLKLAELFGGEKLPGGKIQVGGLDAGFRQRQRIQPGKAPEPVIPGAAQPPPAAPPAARPDSVAAPPPLPPTPDAIPQPQIDAPVMPSLGDERGFNPYIGPYHGPYLYPPRLDPLPPTADTEVTPDQRLPGITVSAEAQPPALPAPHPSYPSPVMGPAGTLSGDPLRRRPGTIPPLEVPNLFPPSYGAVEPPIRDQRLPGITVSAEAQPQPPRGISVPRWADDSAFNPFMGPAGTLSGDPLRRRPGTIPPLEVPNLFPPQRTVEPPLPPTPGAIPQPQIDAPVSEDFGSDMYINPGELVPPALQQPKVPSPGHPDPNAVWSPRESYEDMDWTPGPIDFRTKALPDTKWSVQNRAASLLHGKANQDAGFLPIGFTGNVRSHHQARSRRLREPMPWDIPDEDLPLDQGDVNEIAWGLLNDTAYTNQFMGTAEGDFARATDEGNMAKVENTENFELHDIKKPYLRPAALDFLNRFSTLYRKKFGKPLAVTGLGRETWGRPTSLHRTGRGIDLRTHGGGGIPVEEITWISRALLQLERTGTIAAIMEYKPDPHIHIEVLLKGEPPPTYAAKQDG